MRSIITLLFLFSGVSMIAQDGFPDIFITTGGGTTWNDPASWMALSFIDDPLAVPAGDGIPDGDDLIFINHPIAVGSNQTFGTLEINHDGSHPSALMELTVSAGFTLTGIIGLETGNIAIICSSSSSRISRLKCLGTVFCEDISQTSAGLAGRAFMFVQNGGNLNLNGDLIFSASNSDNSSLTFAGSGNVLNLAGSIGGSGRIFGGVTAATSSFNFVGTTAQIASVASMDITYASVEISNAIGVTTDGDFTNSNMNGTFLVNTGAIFNQGAFNHAFENTVTNDGTYNTSGNIVITGSGGFTNTGTFTSSGANINLAGNWSNTGTYTFTVGDVVTLDGTAGQSVSGTTAFSNLTCANTTGGAADVTFASGTVTIETVFDIDDCAVRNTGASVTLLSTATETAQMADMGTGSYTGDLTVQRQIACSNQGFRELTSPVAGTVLDDWEDDGIAMTGFANSDFPSFTWVSAYRYDEPAAAGVKNNGWKDAVDAAVDSPGPDQAYRIYMDGVTFNMSVTGTPIQGVQSTTVTRSGADDENDGWNFIGNPYPCSIDWNSLSAADKLTVDDIIYTWNSTAGNYGSYIGGAGSGSNGVDNIIASSQGYWVHATASGTIDWEESDKVTTDKAFVKSAAGAPNNWLKVKMSSSMNSFYDEALMRVTKTATNAFDAGADYYKLYSDMLDDVPSVAFVTTDNVDVVMNSIPESTTSITLKAFAGSLALGNYTLDFENIDVFSPTSCVVLEDLVLGTSQDLRTNTSYTYTAIAGDEVTPRFVIHIAVQYDAEAMDATCAITADGLIDINHNTLAGFSLTWSDDAGVLIGAAASTSTNYTISGLLPGDYFVEVGGACVTPEFPITVVGPEAVIAGFTTASSAEVGQILSLTNTSTGATSYAWDMGDGNSYVDAEPIHSYSMPGTYTITLTADNDIIGACTNFKTFIVEVTSTALGIEETVQSNV
ncbi:MAG: PKD domain-containing protein, partial [Flavobacteriales bacterium]|nr:PKD domain-containing protein [Flavobacteriales bacterium]